MGIERRRRGEGNDDDEDDKGSCRLAGRSAAEKRPHKGINVTRDSCLMARKLRCAPVRARARARTQARRSGPRGPEGSRVTLPLSSVGRRGLASCYLEQVRRLARLH